MPTNSNRERCVVSILHGVSCKKPWWNDFPHRITQWLDARDVDHRVLYRTPRDNRKRESSDLTLSAEDLVNPRWVARHLLPLVNRYRHVIVHTHCWPAHTSLWVLKHFARPTCTWLMTDHLAFPATSANTQRWKRMIRRVLRRAGYFPDEFVAVSDYSRSRIERLFGSRGARTIYNGVSLPTISDVPTPGVVPTRALFAGRLIQEKGVRPLLQALKLARDQGLPLTLDVLGDGEEIRWANRFIREHTLQERVRLRGFVRDMVEWYMQSHLMLIPSLWDEPFGLVSVEAQSCYLPCIYSGGGGLVETHIEGVTGIQLRNPENPEEIVEAVRTLQADPVRYHEMRLAAHQNAQRFGIERMVEGYCALYEEVFGG